MEKKNKKIIKIRSCKSCGKNKTKDELLRIILIKEGKLAFDLKQRLDGRGIYTCYDKNCIIKLFKLKEFKKGLSSTSEEFCNMVLEILNNELCGLIAIGEKSGKLAAGYEKALSSIKSGKALLVLTATDISKEKSKKLFSKVEERIKIISFGDKERIGEITGRSAVAYAAFTDIGLSNKFISTYNKLVSLLRSI